jgi:hypothetical protein
MEACCYSYTVTDSITRIRSSACCTVRPAMNKRQQRCNWAVRSHTLMLLLSPHMSQSFFLSICLAVVVSGNRLGVPIRVRNCRAKCGQGTSSEDSGGPQQVFLRQLQLSVAPLRLCGPNPQTCGWPSGRWPCKALTWNSATYPLLIAVHCHGGLQPIQAPTGRKSKAKCSLWSSLPPNPSTSGGSISGLQAVTSGGSMWAPCRTRVIRFVMRTLTWALGVVPQLLRAVLVRSQVPVPALTPHVKRLQKTSEARKLARQPTRKVGPVPTL